MQISEIMNTYQEHTLELQKDLPSNDELAKMICAFSNCLGGDLILGVDPKTGEILGLETDYLFELQENLPKLVASLVEPIPSIVCKIKVVDDKKLFVVSVLSANLKPYYLKGKDKFNGTYIRLGNKNSIATPQMIAELDRLALNVSFDSTPAYDAEVDDLDNELIEAYLDKRTEMFSKPKPLINYAFLDRSKFIKRELGKMYPTICAVLCFSEKANDYCPQAKIRCNIFENNDKKKLVDFKVISGPIIKQIDAVVDFYSDIDLPQDVLRELLLNAIVHRDYSYSVDLIEISLYDDRIEVSSPGALPIGLNIEDISKGVCIYRNSSIYKIFNDMGYSYSALTGIQNANNSLQNSHLENISYKIQDNALVATVYTETSNDYYTKEELKILDYVNDNEYINNTQCQKILRVKGKQAQYILTKLVKKDKLVSIGEKKGRKYQLK